jgi:hypothetical protein
VIVASQIFGAIPPSSLWAEHGTAALGIISPGGFAVLAADSMFSKENKDLPPTFECKVRIYGKFAVVASGLYGKPGTAYDVWECFRKASVGTDSLLQFTATAERLIRPGLTPTFLNLIERFPDRWKTHVGDAPLQYIVVTISTTGPALMMRFFDYTGALPLIATGDPVAYESGPIRFSLIGIHDHMNPNSRELLGLHAEDIAAALVNTEIRNHPETVGGPISVLLISRSGMRWIQAATCK